MENLTKNILIPLDGSKNALNSLDYLDLLYGPEHNLDVSLFYVLPSLPPILTDEKTIDSDIWVRRSDVEKKNTRIVERVLKEAKNVLMKKGFDEEGVLKVHTWGKDLCSGEYSGLILICLD